MPIYFTAIPYNTIADDDTFNDPMAQLDLAIDDHWTFTSAHQTELSAARGPYESLDARLDAMTFGYAGGNIATLTNGTAAAGQKNVTVDSTVGFLVGAYVAYQLVGGAVEYNIIASITPTTVLVLTTNIGTGGIADDSYIGMISVSEYQAANAIPHTGSLTLPQAMDVVGRNVRNVMAYGAVGDGTTDDTAAFVAALAAGDTIELPAEKTFKITSTLTLSDDHTIIGNGSTSIIQFTPSGANDNLFEATEVNRLQFINFKVTGSNNKADCAFLLTNVNEVTFRDVTINGTYTGPAAAFDVAAIHIIGDTGSGADNSADIRISSCWIGGCAGDGIHMSGNNGSQFWLHHSRVTNNSGYGVWAYMPAIWNIITLDTSIVEGNYLGNVLLANVTATRIVGCYLENAADNTAPAIVFDGSACQSIVIEGCNIGAIAADPLIYHTNTIAGGLNYLRNVRISNNRFTGGAGNKVLKSVGVILGATLSQNFLVSFGSDDIRTLLDLNFCSNVVVDDQFGLYHFSEPTEGDITYPIIHFGSDALRLEYPQTPANAGATGNAGEICWDANYVYVCVATNTWKRAAIATWS